MKTIMMAIGLSAGLLFGTSVSAQEAEDVTEYTFEDTILEGDLIGPNDTLVVHRSPGHERSLLKIRQHFIREMLKSIETF